MPEADIVIYGSTSASVATAIQSARLGRSVILVSPSPIIGGIQVNGLGSTDIDNQAEFQNSTTLGGLNLELHQRISKHYGRSDRLDEVVKNRLKDPDVWRFEAHVAEHVISEWLAEHHDRVKIIKGRLAEDPSAVTRKGPLITSIRLQDSTLINGKFFLDTTYEGDLLASPGTSIPWTLGRESSSVYSESLAGIRDKTPYRQIEVPIDPYVVPGDPSSGLLYGISPEGFGVPGEGDRHLQAYSFRLPLTDNPENMVDTKGPQKPEGYDPSKYELHRRFFASGGRGYIPSIRIPGSKTDLIGSESALATDLLGMNDRWPEASYSEREGILKEMRDFTRGLIYFFQTDLSCPEEIRKEWCRFSYPLDEFPGNANFPYDPYVRDGRRMVGDYVITEDTASEGGRDCRKDVVTVAFWPTDTHSVRRVLRDDGKGGKKEVHNEGFIFKDGLHRWRPFGVGLGSLVPPRDEGEGVTNFMTPTCLSSSHVGYGAVRLEHQFYALGQACANAVDIALGLGGIDIQDVPYEELRRRLLGQGVVLDADEVGVPKFPGDE